MERLEEETFYLKFKLAKRKLETYLMNMIDEYTFTNKYDLVDHSKSRLKDYESAKNKLVDRGFIDSLDYSDDYLKDCIDENINDMVGIRLVCPFISDAYKVVELIKELEGEAYIIDDESDYISHPKESGYASYHFDVSVPMTIDGDPILVKAEIQVRTKAMDTWATLDHKVRYKLSSGLNSEFISNQLAEAADEMRLFDKMMDGIKEEVIEINEEKNKSLVKKISER